MVAVGDAEIVVWILGLVNTVSRSCGADCKDGGRTFSSLSSSNVFNQLGHIVYKINLLFEFFANIFIYILV